jgi:hypothetical protein
LSTKNSKQSQVLGEDKEQQQKNCNGHSVVEVQTLSIGVCKFEAMKTVSNATASSSNS